MRPMLLGGTAALRGKAGTKRRRLWGDEVATAVAGSSTDGKKGRRKMRGERERERENPQLHKDVNNPRNSDTADPLVLKKIIHIFMQN